MDNLIIPKDYHSELNLHDTQIAIKTVKDFFQGLLALRLNLSRVSAPLFVDPLSGLNDNLNGVERPVTFDIKEPERQNRGGCSVTCQMEALRAQKIRLFLRGRSLHRHERHPAR